MYKRTSLHQDATKGRVGGPRSRRWLARTVLGTASVLGLAVAGVGTPAASAAAKAARPHETVTFTRTINVPAPPSSNFAGAGGEGDGWAVALSSTQLFNVFHHHPDLGVGCHNQADASVCTGYPKTITDTSGDNFATSGQPGLWLDQATGDLYVFGTRESDDTGGVVCIDTTSSSADPFCGFTALTGTGDAYGSGLSNISDPVLVGTDWYAFNYVNGTPGDAEDQLLCFDTSTLAPCAGQPYAVDTGFSAGDTVADETFPEPAIAAFGPQIVVPIELESEGTVDELGCYDTSTGGNCAGSWPVNVTADNYPYSGGAAFPLLDANGQITGLCLPNGSEPCFDLTGASVTTPTNLASVIGANAVWDGTALTFGPRVYVPDGVNNAVECFDYSTDASCTNFPKALQNLGLLYTVNQDPDRPTCIWVNSDNGADQIQNLDAYTGGPCGSGPVRVLASSFVAPEQNCLPTSWTTLQVTSPYPPSSYGGGSVEFENEDGVPIPGIPTQTLNATATVDLRPFDFGATLPQFVITINNPPQNLVLTVAMTWQGSTVNGCVTPGTSVQGHTGYRLAGGDGGVFAFGGTPFENALPTPGLGIVPAAPISAIAAPDAGGYWLVGRDGGVFAFGDAPFENSLPGIGLTPGAPIVGMAATPDGRGYWLVGADGGVFALGDAVFKGSLPGLGLTPAAPIVGMAATPDGAGYWLVGADGAVYAFGDATFEGSVPGLALSLHGPIVGIEDSDAGGYWLAGADGGVFAFGDATFYNSLPGLPLSPGSPIVGIA